MRRLWEKLWMWWRVWRTRSSLPAISRSDRKDAEEAFQKFCLMWIKGWGMTCMAEQVVDTAKLDEEGNPCYQEDGYPVLVKATRLVEVPVEQPPRVDEMIQLGQGRIARSILIMAYEKGSLQKLVYEALKNHRDKLPPTLQSKSWEEVADTIAANMIQISHVAFPDLQGTYDYTQGWKRSL